MPIYETANRCQRVALAAVALIGVNATLLRAVESELPPQAKLLDSDTFLYGSPYPAVSPDAKWVAYVSKGFICVCNVDKPDPRRIMEVPNSFTWPNFRVGSGNTVKSGAFGELAHGLQREKYNKLNEQVTKTIYGLNWTHDSTGFVFGVLTHDRNAKTSTYDCDVASTDGAVTRLAHTDSDPRVRSVLTGVLTRDRKFLVSPVAAASTPRDRPLIWSVSERKPCATPFLYLTPSAMSGRWLAIEKDTKQLVIADERFQVIKRFNEFMPASFSGLRIDWSSDERFIIWRNQLGFDHFSNWEGFRMNLDTGEKREIDGRFIDEQFGFTGRGGEFFRCGQTGAKTKSYDAVVGAHLTLIPDSSAAAIDLWRLKIGPNDQRPGMLTNRPGNPPCHISSDANYFAIGLPRPAGQRSGAHWHLIDRKGKKWRFPGDDNGEYISPYQLAGFADNGKVIVAYDKSRLFAIPIATVISAANEVK